MKIKGFIGKMINIPMNKRKIKYMVSNKRIKVQGPKIVVIGGGTGLSTMLRGLKVYTSNITAIVTVADDGGGSGELREELGILPPGDIRNCILALSDTEPIMEELLQYRFKDGKLKNQSFGNLFLAAMNGISDNFEEAIEKVSSVLAVTGRVLPVTLEDIVLKAELSNGTIAYGESNIPNVVIKNKSKIKKVSIEPKDAKPLKEAVDAILDADAIILGPGSLYTSIIPNLLVKDINKAISESESMKIYVSNIMTQKGETEDYSVYEHISAINSHCGDNFIDYAIVNIGDICEDLKNKYALENSKIVFNDQDKIKQIGIEIIKDNFIKVKNGYIRHDTDKLSKRIIETIMENKLIYDKEKIVEYYYLSEIIKNNKRNKV